MIEIAILIVIIGNKNFCFIKNFYILNYQN